MTMIFSAKAYAADYQRIPSKYDPDLKAGNYWFHTETDWNTGDGTVMFSDDKVSYQKGPIVENFYSAWTNGKYIVCLECRENGSVILHKYSVPKQREVAADNIKVPKAPSDDVHYLITSIKGNYAYITMEDYETALIQNTYKVDIRSGALKLTKNKYRIWSRHGSLVFLASEVRQNERGGGGTVLLCRIKPDGSFKKIAKIGDYVRNVSIINKKIYYCVCPGKHFSIYTCNLKGTGRKMIRRFSIKKYTDLKDIAFEKKYVNFSTYNGSYRYFYKTGKVKKLK